MKRLALPLIPYFLGLSLYFTSWEGIHDFWRLLAIFILQFSAYFYWWSQGEKKRFFSLPAIWGIALLVRALCLFSDPILEDDYHRYLWDGHIISHGINPYLYAPEDPELNHLSTNYRDKINYGYIPTIYPPAAQYIFAAIHFLGPDSLLFLKLALLFFDLLTGALLCLWLRERKSDMRWSFLYLLCPLLLKEVANSAHYDIIPVFFSSLAVFLFLQKRNLLSWVTLAIAAMTKLYPLIFIPFFLRWEKRRIRSVFVFLLTVVLLYLPFIDAGMKLFSGTEAFARFWIFNASFFELFFQTIKGLAVWIAPGSEFTASKLVQHGLIAKGIMSFSFGLGLLFLLFKSKEENVLPRQLLAVLGLLFITSPVVNGWYVLWLLPFAVLERSRPWLAFCFLVVAGYSFFYDESKIYYFHIIEYGVLFTLLYISRKKTTEFLL